MWDMGIYGTYISEYFNSDNNPRCNELMSTINRLKADTDPDVRYFINRLPQTDIDIPLMVSMTADSRSIIHSEVKAYQLNLVFGLLCLTY